VTLEPEVGMEFDGIVTRMMTFGAFVEIVPGKEGLVHISEMDWKRTEQVEDICKTGDAMRVKLIKVDDQGRLDLSRKALLDKPEGYVEPPPRAATAIGEVAVVAEAALVVAEEADGMVNAATDHLGKNASKNRIPT